MFKDDIKRKGIIWSASTSHGSKKMKFTTYDKLGRPHHTIKFDEASLEHLMGTIKCAFGEDDHNE